MSSLLPASLAYLLVYNPTLPPPPNTSRDDEDAQEEAHILFYTSRERVMSRDKMLRQVGLAKALVNFSEIFTPEQGCDSVHSQGRRLVSISPEPDFWMHICVDLAKTPKQNKSKGKAAKSNEPTYYYHEESVHDLALRAYLRRGYEDFKLLHGTYASILKDGEPGTLEAHLERFFTAWAWQWDFETINDFSAHLGLPLHPLNSTLSPILSSFISDLPSNTIPILLSPPYIIESSESSVASYPPSLPRYLLSSIHSPRRPRPLSHRKLSIGQELSNSGTISRRGNTSVSNNIQGFLSVSGANVGQVLSVKKWPWPASFTFGKTRSVSQPPEPGVGNSAIQSGAQPAPLVNESNSATKADDRVNDAEDSRPYIEGGVNQSALDDAMLSIPPAQQSSKGTEAVTQDMTEGQTPQSDEPQLNEPSPVATQQPGDMVSSGSGSVDLSTSHLALSQPLGPSFSTLMVFISEPSMPLVVRQRRVLHISLFQLVFALLMDAEWPDEGVDESQEYLAQKIPKFLAKMRRTIDKGCTNGTPPTTKLRSGVDITKHIICSPRHIISANADLPTTSSFFFESQEILTRNSDTLETYARSATPQHWFVARRGLGFDKDGDEIPGEAYLQSNNKEASLVDAENELVSAVRRWANTEYRI